MQKRVAPFSLASFAAVDDFLHLHQRLALGRFVTRRLRAVVAVLRTAAGLDRDQRRALDFVRIEVLAMHLMRTEQQVHQRHLVERLDLRDGPLGTGRARSSIGRQINGGRNGIHEQGLVKKGDMREIGWHNPDADREHLPRLPPERCPNCALPTPHGAICGRCLAHPPHYDATQSAFAYDFPLDRLVQSLKYSHRLALAGFLGHQIAVLAKEVEADLIVPMPLHAKRLRERGFNQALELARPVGRATGLPIDTTSCQRIRHTPAQAALPWRERVKNIRGAFHCTTDFSGKRLSS
jgi:predicted amidophosphoribosyltransferase